MTTEQQTSEPVATPTAAPPTPTTAPASSADVGEMDDADIFAEAVRVAAQESEPEPTPDAAPQAAPTPEPEPTEAKPDTPPAEGEEKLPSWADLQAEIAQRQQQRQQTQPQVPAQPEPQTQQEVEQQRADAVVDRIPIDQLRKELQENPVAAAAKYGLNPRELIHSFAKATFGGGKQAEPEKPKAVDPDEIQRLVDQRVQDQLRAYQEKVEREQAEQEQAARRHNAEVQFQQLTSDSEAFPMLSRLGDEERVWYGHRYAKAFLAAGRQPTDTQIAQAIERDLAERFSPAASTGSADKNKSAAGDEKPTGQSGPTTLSQSLPAQPSTIAEPQSDDDYIAAAMRVAAAEMAGG